jgi:serine/threonine protein kinase/lipoprotein NlpI
MSSCPGRDSLQGLLDEPLSEPELAEIVVHIEICLPCQEELEKLTSGHGWRSTVREIPSQSDESARPSPHAGGDQTVDRSDSAGSDEAIDRRDRAGRNSDSLAGDVPPAASVRTMTASGPPDASPRSDSPRARTHWPVVPGYEIQSRLGEGGMGVVYKARQVGLNRMVALKMIRGGSQARPDHLLRFSIEAEAVARLRHQNIIQIFDIGEIDGSPYVSLELLEGGSLADRLSGTPQPGRSAAELLETLVLAIVAAHEAGIIHRDLKPSNVLFTEEGVMRVTDFGLAKRLESDDMHTETGQVMGSPSYMAPEQARGHSRNIGPPADVYALGAILYEMLTGRPPFKGETAIETIRQVMDDEPVPPSRLVPRVPRDLETISLKCLNKEAHKRYASAQALANDLRRYINREPIKARPTPFWERGAKWARRRPVKAFSLAFGTAVVLCALGSFWAYERYEAHQLVLARQTNTNDVFDAQSKERSNPQDALSILKVVRERIAAHPAGQRDLDDRARGLIEQIGKRLADLAVNDKDQKRSEQFFAASQQAFAHDTQFTGLEISDNRQATRRVARAALDVFGSRTTSGSWSLEALPDAFSAELKDRIRERCYELLLVLAEAVDQPTEGLSLLDQAAQLRRPDKTYHLRRAVYLSKTGDAAGAERERKAADATSPATPVDHFLAGWELYDRGDLAAAGDHFDFTLARQPGHFWAKCLSSLCELRLGRPRVAQVRLTAFIEREPDNAWLYVWRGLASSQLAAQPGDRTRRGQAQNAGIANEATDHQFQLALADYDKVLELLANKPDNLLRWVLLVNRGNLFVQHDAWEKASADFQAAASLDASRYEPFAGLAILYQRQHKPNEAIEQFDRAIALKPDLAGLYRGRAEVNLARTGATTGERARALADLDQAIRVEAPANPVLAIDHTRRAMLLREAHRLPEALAACDAAVRVDRDRTESHLLRIQLLLELSRFDDVIRSCDALLARDKSSAWVYELRGLARAKLNDFAGAIDDDTQAIALAPGAAVLFLRRGDLYLVSDAPKLAKHDFDEALRLDPSSSDALIGRAAARVRLGEHGEAVLDADKGLSLGTMTPKQLYSATKTYARAAAVAGAQVRTKGREYVSLVEKYQDRGVWLLRESIKKLPLAERAAFWRDVVQKDPDPAMNAIRRRLRASDWDAQASLSPGGRHDQP